MEGKIYFEPNERYKFLAEKPENYGFRFNLDKEAIPYIEDKYFIDTAHPNFVWFQDNADQLYQQIILNANNRYGDK